MSRLLDDDWQAIWTWYYGRGGLYIRPGRLLKFLAQIDKRRRHKALELIFKILGASTMQKRTIATRVIVHAICIYHDGFGFFGQPRKERLKWLRRVHRHALALARAAREHELEFGYSIMWAIGDLSVAEARAVAKRHPAQRPSGSREAVAFAVGELELWAENAAFVGGFGDRQYSPRRLDDSPDPHEATRATHSDANVMPLEARGRKRIRPRAPRLSDTRHVEMVSTLRELYFLAAGENPKRTPPDQHEHDASVKFFHAVWVLAGVKRAEATISDDIGECRGIYGGWKDEEAFGADFYRGWDWGA